MRHHRWLILLTLHAGVCLAQTGKALPLIMLVEDRPPLIELASGGLHGTLGARADAILHSSRLRFQYAHANIDEQLARVRDNKEQVCAVGRVRTAERARQGQFSAPFFASAAYVALVRNDAEWLSGAPFLKDWAHNAKLRWGVKQDYFYDEYVSAQMHSALARKIVFSVGNTDAAELLRRKEVDFILMHQEEAQLFLVSQPAAGAQIEVLRLHDLLEGEFRYFYCSHSVPPALLDQLNQGIRQVQENRPY